MTNWFVVIIKISNLGRYQKFLFLWFVQKFKNISRHQFLNNCSALSSSFTVLEPWRKLSFGHGCQRNFIENLCHGWSLQQGFVSLDHISVSWVTILLDKGKFCFWGYVITRSVEWAVRVDRATNQLINGCVTVAADEAVSCLTSAVSLLVLLLTTVVCVDSFICFIVT